MFNFFFVEFLFLTTLSPLGVPSAAHNRRFVKIEQVNECRDTHQRHERSQEFPAQHEYVIGP